jgi:hypothetical protein
MRSAGLELCEARRGVPACRSKLLPIPIKGNTTVDSQAQAKRDLGISENTILLFSVATAYKYRTSAMHFADLLLPVVLENPNVLLLVIGPGEEGPWATARHQSGGRIRALGKMSQVDSYYDAADVYLDSFPIASLTSSLEGGIRGVPVVSYWCYPPEAEVLSSEDPALTEVMCRGRTVEEYRTIVRRLIQDPDLRAQVGIRTRDRIAACHSSPGWLDYLEKLYTNIPADPRGESSPVVERMITELDLQLAKTYKVSGLSSGKERVIRDHVGMFPFKTRLQFWMNELGLGARALPTCLLSDGLKTRLRILRSQLAED